MKYGLVDMGSNTVVLVIYEVNNLDEMPTVLVHESTPVRLVSYIKDGHMDHKGILKAKEVLREYLTIIEEVGIETYYAFMTEPARNIDNLDEMLKEFEEVGFKVEALTGKQEAEYDFAGSQLAYHEIPSGNAFDIGGGSTELITFENHTIKEAVSIPYGCVRLSQLPIEKEFVDTILKETFEEYPLLNSIKNDVLIGIGGTCRATYQVINAIHHTGKRFPVEYAEELYTKLLNEDSEVQEVLKRELNKNRRQVLLPGLNMLLGITRIFNAKEIQFSTGCVREGFLYNKIKNSSK